MVLVRIGIAKNQNVVGIQSTFQPQWLATCSIVVFPEVASLPNGQRIICCYQHGMYVRFEEGLHCSCPPPTWR